MAKQPDDEAAPDPRRGVQMSLRRDIYAQLKKLARRNSISAAAQLRMLVIAALSAAEPPLWPPAGEGPPARE